MTQSTRWRSAVAVDVLNFINSVAPELNIEGETAISRCGCSPIARFNLQEPLHGSGEVTVPGRSETSDWPEYWPRPRESRAGAAPHGRTNIQYPSALEN